MFVFVSLNNCQLSEPGVKIHTSRVKRKQRQKSHSFHGLSVFGLHLHDVAVRALLLWGLKMDLTYQQAADGCVRPADLFLRGSRREDTLDEYLGWIMLEEFLCCQSADDIKLWCVTGYELILYQLNLAPVPRCFLYPVVRKQRHHSDFEEVDGAEHFLWSKAKYSFSWFFCQLQWSISFLSAVNVFLQCLSLILPAEVKKII